MTLDALPIGGNAVGLIEPDAPPDAEPEKLADAVGLTEPDAPPDADAVGLTDPEAEPEKLTDAVGLTEPDTPPDADAVGLTDPEAEPEKLTDAVGLTEPDAPPDAQDAEPKKLVDAVGLTEPDTPPDGQLDPEGSAPYGRVRVTVLVVPQVRVWLGWGKKLVNVLADACVSGTRLTVESINVHRGRPVVQWGCLDEASRQDDGHESEKLGFIQHRWS
jgi:hypothetical protein